MATPEGWRGLCRKKDIIPLKLVPFLPQDNCDDGRHEAIRRATSELGRCLTLPFPTFLSFVLEDTVLDKFVDTFLRFRRRHYEYPQAEEEPSSTSPLPELGRRVFLVLLRAVGLEHASLAEERERAVKSSTSAKQKQTPGELLVSKGGMLAPPAVLDVCALYGRSNPVLVAGLLRSLGELDGGSVGARLTEGLIDAGLASARALAEVHAKVAGAGEGVGEESIGPAEASDLLSYIVDVSATVGSLLQISCMSAAAEGPKCGGGSQGRVSSGLTTLASRLQGQDGEVSPEGLAAALALTFEATLPALEGLLQHPPKGDQAPAAADPGAAIANEGRLSMARQWLLRCLHWLLGPVFLHPLGLQEGEASASTGGRVDPDTRSEVADGLLRFVTSLAAASGHLAPTGRAGCLLGEYSRRFSLADAVEQADAFATLPTPPPRVALAAGAGPAAGVLESGLGAERTHYLAGVLRALPSVLPGEEGIFTEGELKEEGYDSTSRGVDGASGVGSEPGNGRPPEGPEELEDLVKSVQAVLGGVEDDPGGLGEGFVEACLSVLDWSPQAVIGAVLEDRLPPQVAGLDRGLRRAWKGKKGELDKGYRVDKDLAAAEAKRLIAFERQQEDDAYLLSKEYDDDYDDQYDDREVNVGGVASGLGDIEAVRRVNQLLREEEEEEAWWEGAKNTNRSVSAPRGSGKWRAGAQEEDEVDDQEEIAEGTGNGGRSGGRGGRSGGRGGGRSGSIPGGDGGGGRTGGRGRGGRGGDGDGDGAGRGGKSAERIQQRRKAANKAAVGNHNRKNAARKKESKGMF